MTDTLETIAQQIPQVESAAASRWLDEVSDHQSGIRKPRPVRTPPGRVSLNMSADEMPGCPFDSNDEEYLRITQQAFRDLVEIAQGLVGITAQLYTWTATSGTRITGDDQQDQPDSCTS